MKVPIPLSACPALACACPLHPQRRQVLGGESFCWTSGLASQPVKRRGFRKNLYGFTECLPFFIPLLNAKLPLHCRFSAYPNNPQYDCGR